MVTLHKRFARRVHSFIYVTCQLGQDVVHLHVIDVGYAHVLSFAGVKYLD